MQMHEGLQYMRSESPEKLPAFTGGSEAHEIGRKLLILISNPPFMSGEGNTNSGGVAERFFSIESSS